MESSAATRPGSAQRKLCRTCNRGATPVATCPTGTGSTADHRIIAVATGAGSVPICWDGVWLAAASALQNIQRQLEIPTRLSLPEILRTFLTSPDNP